MSFGVFGWCFGGEVNLSVHHNQNLGGVLLNLHPQKVCIYISTHLISSICLSTYLPTYCIYLPLEFLYSIHPCTVTIFSMSWRIVSSHLTQLFHLNDSRHMARHRQKWTVLTPNPPWILHKMQKNKFQQHILPNDGEFNLWWKYPMIDPHPFKQNPFPQQVPHIPSATSWAQNIDQGVSLPQTFSQSGGFSQQKLPVTKKRTSEFFVLLLNRRPWKKNITNFVFLLNM